MNPSSRTVLIPSIVLLIGTVFGTGATNAFADDPFDNEVNIKTDTDNTNPCDESGDGDNNVDCEIDSTKDIGPISIFPLVP